MWRLLIFKKRTRPYIKTYNIVQTGWGGWFLFTVPAMIDGHANQLKEGRQCGGGLHLWPPRNVGRLIVWLTGPLSYAPAMVIDSKFHFKLHPFLY